MTCALLYPQNLFYPLKSLRVLDFVDKVFVFEFFDTSTYLQKFFPELQEKIGYISLRADEKLKLRDLPNILTNLQLFGEYIRTPENLSYYYLYQDLFEETFSIKIRERDSSEEIKRAFLILLLAENLDANLLEVEKALISFEEKWEKFFQKNILFEDQLYENLAIREWVSGPENLWNLKRRVEALKRVIPFFCWEKVSFLDTLLITEADLLWEMKEEALILSETELSKGIYLLKTNKSLNKNLGLPEEENFPKFVQILAVF